MPIDLPDSQKEVEQRAKTDVQRNLPGSNPFLKNSYLGALTTGFSLRVFDFYTQLEEVIKQMFVQTATDEFLAMFGSWFDITRNPATQAVGNVIATGIVGGTIPAGTTLQSSDARQYEVDTESVIAANVISVTLVQVGSTVTATAVNDHNLSSLVSVTIADADQAQFNGTFSIVITSATEFTYEIVEPATAATGTITASFDSVSMPVTSVEFGDLENQLANTALTFTSPIAGVDGTAGVDFNELAGGTDLESDEDFRDRVIDRVQNPVANFNVAAIVTQAREVPGVTRVFVFEITDENGDEAIGEVSIFFTRDNDDNIIPQSSEVTTVKNKILEIKPAHTADADVHVAAPIPAGNDGPSPSATSFTFAGSLLPTGSTMQDAVTTSLTELFLRSEVGVDVTANDYNAAITTTVDRETGNTVESFTLTEPSGNIAINYGELAVLGTVTF